MATAPQIQIVIATIGTWSCTPLIRSGANTLLSARASQRPPTATAAGNNRPVRWSGWAVSVRRVSTWVAVMRSPPSTERLASATSWRGHAGAVIDSWPRTRPGRKGRPSLAVTVHRPIGRSLGPLSGPSADQQSSPLAERSWLRRRRWDFDHRSRNWRQHAVRCHGGRIRLLTSNNHLSQRRSQRPLMAHHVSAVCGPGVAPPWPERSALMLLSAFSGAAPDTSGPAPWDTRSKPSCPTMTISRAVGVCWFWMSPKQPPKSRV